MIQADLSHIPSASLSLHTRGAVTLVHPTPDAVQISVVSFMRCHAAPEGQWMGRKPVVVNRPGSLRPADLSKRRKLFTDYTLQTAKRLSLLRRQILIFRLSRLILHSAVLCFHGRPWQTTDVPQPSWLIVPPALDVPALATRCIRAYRRVPHSSPRAYRRVPHSSGGSWNLWTENEDRQFSLKCRLPRYILGIFYMPHICDMGPTALLPFRRKACWGFFRP
jgi:hypothetical protein